MSEANDVAAELPIVLTFDVTEADEIETTIYASERVTPARSSRTRSAATFGFATGLFLWLVVDAQTATRGVIAASACTIAALVMYLITPRLRRSHFERFVAAIRASRTSHQMTLTVDRDRMRATIDILTFDVPWPRLLEIERSGDRCYFFASSQAVLAVSRERFDDDAAYEAFIATVHELAVAGGSPIGDPAHRCLGCSYRVKKSDGTCPECGRPTDDAEPF